MEADKKELRVALLLNKYNYHRTLHPDDLDFLRSFADVLNEGSCPDVIDEAFMIDALTTANACISCWGTSKFTKSVLDSAPSLRIIGHTAGTPKAIVTDTVWEKGIRVCTSAPIIAIDVAETTLGAMIYLLKRMDYFDKIVRSGTWGDKDNKIMDQKYSMRRLNYRLTVGIVGASHVGKNLIRLLQPFGVKIKLYDPYISEFQAREIGVDKVSLEELMSSSDVVTIHAPNLPQTHHMIDKAKLALLKDGALFINTSRGAIVDENSLINELKSGRIVAYLDVFDKEPLAKDNVLYQLENVLLTPHISGGHTVNGGFERGNYIIQQLYSYYTCGILKDEVTKDMMEIMA